VSYGQQPGGYGQNDLRVGMPVSSDNGWTGTITEVIPAAPGYDGAVRVAWHGDGTTLVALSMFVVENGQALIRTQPPPPRAAPAPQAVQPAAMQPSEDEMQTRLASPSPVQNDPTHVNPYVQDPPLVTPEPPPIHPTHGGQYQDDDLTYVPPAPRQESAGMETVEDFTAAPPAPREVEPVSTGIAAPTEAMATGAAEPHVVDAAQQEVTVPIIEERVEAHPEWREAGSIVVRTVMEEIPQTLTQETEREELFVDRVAVGRHLEEGEEVAPREEGDTYIIPIVVEEAVVVTRRILIEELRVTKRIIPTTQTVQTVVRKERVEIDAGDLADRVHEDSGTDAATDMPQATRTDTPS
jgi:stress response protein YsnF